MTNSQTSNNEPVERDNNKTRPTGNNELDNLMHKMGEKIVNGIYISVAMDKDYDTEPLEEWLKQQLSNLIKEIIGKTNDNYLDMTIEDLLAVQRQRATNLGFNIGKDKV
jgi:proline dehydrogenase